MSRKRYEYYPQDGQWFEVDENGDRLVCCDCNLTHDLMAKIVDGRIYLMVKRNNKATAARRRKR